MGKRLAKIILTLIALLTCMFSYQIQFIEFDYELEKFFPQSGENTAFFNQYRKDFSTDNDILLIGLESEKTIFSKEFISKSSHFFNELSQIENVEQAFSIYNSPGGFYFENKLDSNQINTLPELSSSFVSKDKKSLSFLLLHKPYLSKKGCDNLVRDVNSLLSEYKFHKVHLAGRSVAQKYYVETSQKELTLFFSIGLFLLIVVLFFTFRTLWGVVIPLLVVLLSMLWTIGLMVILGEPFSLLLTILPIIIFVVGISDVIHIVSRFLDLLRENHSKINALKQAFKEVGLATFFTSITTAFGFLTLLLSDIEPIRSFGLFTAMGVFIAYILAFSFLPSVLFLINAPSNKAFEFGSVFWRKKLSNLFLLILKKKQQITFLSILLVVLSGIGISNLKVENLMLEDLQEDSEIKQSLNFFDLNYAGVRPFELQLEVVDKNKSIFDQEVLFEINKIENYLTNEYGIKAIVSPVTLVKTANYISTTNPNFELPNSKRKLKQIADQIKQNTPKGLFAYNFKKARLSGRSEDLGSSYYQEKNQKFLSFVKENISAELLKVRLTGSANLIDENNKTLSMNLLLGLVIAFLVVAIIVGFIFKSIKMVVLALIPNILPLVFIAAIMGYFGINIKVSTSIIFTIAFGIAVDDTLHFINKLKIELNKGKSLALSVKNTFTSSGKAIIITSLILITGFVSLIASSFSGTFYIGLLVSLTLILAVITDLLLLPLLILKFYKIKTNKKEA